MLLNCICTDDYYVIIMKRKGLYYAFMCQHNRLHDAKIRIQNSCIEYVIDYSKHYKIDFLEDHVKLGNTKMEVISAVDLSFNIEIYHK